MRGRDLILKTGGFKLSLTAQVQALFAAGKVGGMWDMGDTSTLFQNYATPVTAVTQPIGMVLDKSQGLVLGAELVTNGEFSGGTSGWVPRAGAATHAVVGGEMEVTAIATSAQVTEQSFSVVSGRTYKVTGTMRAAGTNSVANSARISILGATVFSLAQVSANGVQTPFSLFVIANSSTFQVQLSVASFAAWGAIGDKAYFDNVSVKELPGNHALQATSGARPTYSARVNGLLSSDGHAGGTITPGTGLVVMATGQPDSLGGNTARQIRNTTTNEQHRLFTSVSGVGRNSYFVDIKNVDAGWIHLSMNGAVQVIGAYFNVATGAVGTLQTTGAPATSSIASLGGGWYRCQLNAPSNETSVTNVQLYVLESDIGTINPFIIQTAKSVYVGAAQLAPFGTTTYQRVNTASDYDTVGFPAFAQFDATDDALLFPAITFGGAFNTFVAGKVTSGTRGIHLWRTADADNGYWAVYENASGLPPNQVTGVGSPSYAVNGVALSPVTREQIYTLINGVDSVTETTGIVLSAETALQFSGYAGGYLFQGNSHRVLMISGTLTAGEKLLCRQWCAEGNGVAVV